MLEGESPALSRCFWTLFNFMAFLSCQRWRAAMTLLSTLKEWHLGLLKQEMFKDRWNLFSRVLLTLPINTFPINYTCWNFIYYICILKCIQIHVCVCRVQHLCVHLFCTNIFAGQTMCIYCSCVLVSTMWVFFVFFHAGLLMPQLPGACYHLS